MTFFIPGKPFGKQSIRFGKHGAYTKKATRQSMKKAAVCFLQAHGEYIEGAVAMTVTAYFERPKKHYGTGKFLHMVKEAFKRIFCTVKPDLSNICKGLEDGLNKLAYKDDAYIVDFHYNKRYANPGERVGLFVTIESATWHENGNALPPEHRHHLTPPRIV